MPNKELNSFYKKLSKSNNTKTMSYSDNEIVLDCSLDEIEVPSGYEIIDGSVMKDGVVSIGRVIVNEPKKEDSPTSILNTLANALEEDEDLDEDIDEDIDEEINESEVIELDELNGNRIDSAFVVYEDEIEDNDFIEEENIFNEEPIKEETSKKSKKRGKRLAQFISYKFSSKKDYVEADNNLISNYISKEDHERILSETIKEYQDKFREMQLAYDIKINTLTEENNQLRLLSDQLVEENNSLKKIKRKRSSAKTC